MRKIVKKKERKKEKKRALEEERQSQCERNLVSEGQREKRMKDRE